MSDMNDDLTARLRALPTEIAPQRDLMPGIRERLDQSHVRTRRTTRFVQVAAAAAIFVAGVAIGRTSIGRDALNARLAPPTGAFEAAAEVQRTGTEYVAALARASRMVADEGLRAQARESALASLATAAREVSMLASPDTVFTRF
jgi:hypothetical protein